jgi:hypothetical protein
LYRPIGGHLNDFFAETGGISTFAISQITS